MFWRDRRAEAFADNMIFYKKYWVMKCTLNSLLEQVLSVLFLFGLRCESRKNVFSLIFVLDFTLRPFNVNMSQGAFYWDHIRGLKIVEGTIKE